MALPPNPTNRPVRPRSGGAGKTFLVVTGISLGVGALVGLVFLLVGLLPHDRHDRDAGDDGVDSGYTENGENPQEAAGDMRDVRDMAAAEPVASPEPARNPSGLNGPCHGTGNLSDLPCSFDVTFSPSGTVSGTFWNLLYNIKLPVSGTVDADGSLSLELGTGSTLSRMSLRPRSEGSMEYSGIWGNKGKTVSISFQTGGRNQQPASGGTELTLKGGGMTTHPYLVRENADGGYIYFSGQPFANRLPCVFYGEDVEVHSPFDGHRIARFSMPGYGETNSFHIVNGNDFEISLK